MKSTLLGLVVLLLDSPTAGQHSRPIEALHPATFVTQLGRTYFPAFEAETLDYSAAVAVLGSRGVVVVGHTGGSLGEPHAGPFEVPDLFVARFDPLGEPDWIRQVGQTTAVTIPALNGDAAGPGGDASVDDAAFGVAAAPDGSIFVTGGTWSSLGETLNVQCDLFLAKLAPDGSLRWLRQFGVESEGLFPRAGSFTVSTSGSEGGDAIALDPSGAVYVAGTTSGNFAEGNAGVTDVFLARFSADGEPEWVRQIGLRTSMQIGFPAHGEDFAPDVAVHPSGVVFVSCTSLVGADDMFVSLFAFDALGTPLGFRSLAPRDGLVFAGDVAVDAASGRVFLVGSVVGELAEPNAGSDAFAACFDDDLELQWIRQLGPATAASLGLDATQDDAVVACCVNAVGDLILAGGTNGSLAESNGGAGFDVFTAKLRGSDGAILRVSQVGAITGPGAGIDPSADEATSDVALGPRGTIVVTGSTLGNLADVQAGQWDVFVMRLAPDGTL